MTRQVQKDMAVALSRLFRNLPLSEKIRPSVLKNPLHKLNKFNIVAGDQEFVLQLLDQALEEVTKPSGTKVLVYLTMLGEKSPTPVPNHSSIEDGPSEPSW